MMAKAAVETIQLTNNSAPVGFPKKVNVELHTLDVESSTQSISLMMIYEGIVTIGFGKKGSKVMKAFGFVDTTTIAKLRDFVVRLTWPEKERDFLVTEAYLDKINAELSESPSDDAYLQRLKIRLGLVTEAILPEGVTPESLTPQE